MSPLSRYPAYDGSRAFEFLTRAFHFEQRLSREVERLIQHAERRRWDDQIKVVKRESRRAR